MKYLHCTCVLTFRNATMHEIKLAQIEAFAFTSFQTANPRLVQNIQFLQSDLSFKEIYLASNRYKQTKKSGSGQKPPMSTEVKEHTQRKTHGYGHARAVTLCGGGRQENRV